MRVDLWGDFSVDKQNSSNYQRFKRMILAIIVGTVILILGAFAFNNKSFAADQATLSSPFSMTDSINSSKDYKYTSQEAIHFSFDLMKGERIQKNDQIIINVDKDGTGTPGFDLSSLQINSISSNNFFTVTTDGSSSPAKIIITATKDVDYSTLAQAGISLYAKPSKSTANTDKEATYHVSIDYKRGNQTANILADKSFNVDNSSSSGGGVVTKISQQIFGGLSGLPVPTEILKLNGENRFDVNYYADFNNDTSVNKGLLYWYTRNAFVAWAEITLPDAKDVPKSLTWTLSTDPSNLPFYTPMMKVYKTGDNDHPTSEWSVVNSTPNKVTFKATNLSKFHS